jgi:hypothetical protein
VLDDESRDSNELKASKEFMPAVLGGDNGVCAPEPLVRTADGIELFGGREGIEGVEGRGLGADE